MAKRGETRPYKVRYQWTNGIKGTNAYSSRDLADLKADEIRANGARRDDVSVTVTVTYEPRPANGKA